MPNSTFKTINYEDFLSLTKQQLFEIFTAKEVELRAKETALLDIQTYVTGLEDQLIKINGQLVLLKNKLFGRSSEKSKNKKKNKSKNPKPSPKARNKRDNSKLSEKYKDLPIMEQSVELRDLPSCTCCKAQMQDSGMREISEFLHVIPAIFMIIRQIRHKYRCTKCHGGITTAPAPPRILPGSAYSDEMIQDVALSKYCDLIPIERYSAIAGRSGLVSLPPNSLIGITHSLAEFFASTYEKLRDEILAAVVLHADETPHKMLEGDEKMNWYLWGFSTEQTSYFEIHDTRSGDVASDILTRSQCEYLVSDVFSGYQKAVRESNKIRENLKKPLIQSAYCNAHCRRKFNDAGKDDFEKEVEYFLECYRKIYTLENEGQEAGEAVLAKKRKAMVEIFEQMKSHANSELNSYSSKSSYFRALNYFLKNFVEFTHFTKNSTIPIDNNLQERLLRNAVIGRKTWYGTHSKRGAETAAVLFSLVESCKLNKVNPRVYFKELVSALHAKRPSFTPREFVARAN